MSDREWYEGLTGKDLAGKHVHVVFKTGTVVDGRLELDGYIRVSPTCRVGVLYPRNGGAWESSPLEPFRGVESVSLVWDERDWEQIPIEDAEEGDVLVIGESKEDIFEIHGKNSADRWWAINNDEDSCITPGMISCVLRKKSKLPTKPGFYGSCMDGEFIYLSHDDDWWLFDSDGMVHLENPPTDFLPLTPVHFVDGRAE